MAEGEGMKKEGVLPLLEGNDKPQGRRGSPMWTMIPSLAPIVETLAPTFTQPSAVTATQLLLAGVMCLGRHTLRRTAEHVHPDCLPDHSRRHGLDSYHNFFERSAWTPQGLAQRVGILLLTRLRLFGVITLLVDDTLVHKRGKSVWGLGWFRDAVASTQKRVATASGHNWVVLAGAFCVPFTHAPILALPLLARLHMPGAGQPSCAEKEGLPLVHDGLAGEPVGGDYHVCLEMGDRGSVPREQAGDGHRGAAAAKPGECGEGVVCHGGLRDGGGGGIAGCDGGVGQGVVVASYGASVTPGHS